MQEIEKKIETVFLSSNNEERTQTESQLISECLIKLEKFLMLTVIVQTPDHIYAQHATILLNNLTKKFRQETPDQYSLNHFSALFQLIASPLVSIQNRVLLVDGLANILIADEDNLAFLDLKNKLMGNIRSLMKKPELRDIISISLFFQSIIKSMEFGTYHFIMNPSKCTDWFADFLKVTKHLMNQIKNENVNQNELFDTIAIFSKTLTEMCSQIFNLKGRQRSSSLAFQNTIMNSQSFQEYLYSIITYKHHDMMYYLFYEKESESTINQTKLDALKCYFYMFKTIVLERDDEEWEKISLTKFYSQVSLAVAYGALTFMKVHSVNELKEIHIQIFSYALSILSYATIKYASAFSDGKITYIIDLIYPFVVSTKQEIFDMIENPSEFVQLSLDAIDYHKSQVPKVGALNLLQNLCKHIDDCASFFLQLVISVAKQAIFEMTGFQMATNFEQQVIFDIKERSFFKFYSAIERIESSLVLLAALSSSLSKSMKHLIQIENFLVQALPFFLQTNEKIVQVRLILFLGYYCNELLKREEDHLGYLIQYLDLIVRCISIDQQVILYQAVDALVEIFDNKQISHKLTSIVPTLYDILCKTLISSNEYQHFSLINKLLYNFKKLFVDQPQALTNLAQVLVQRILKEEEVIKSGNRSQYFYCSRCWSLLKELLKEEFKSFIPSLNQILSPLYEQISSGQASYFEEELFIFVNEEIQLAKSVTVQQFKLLNIFPFLIKKKNDRLLIIFETLNLFLKHGKIHFLDEKIQQQYFALAFQVLQSKSIEITDEDRGLGAHLLQVGIELLNKDLKTNILQPIFTQLIKQLQSDEVNKLVKSRICSVFWASFYVIPEITFQLLPQSFETIYQQLLLYKQNFGCDNKIRIISECKIIINDPHRFTSSSILNLAYALQYQHENFYTDWDQVDYNGLIDDDDDEVYFYCDDYHFIQSLQEDVQIFYKSSSPMLKLNEYEGFKELFTHMKEKYPQFIELLNSQLEQSEIAIINKVLSYIKVEVEEGYDESRKIIKATKQKNQKWHQKQNQNQNQKS